MTKTILNGWLLKSIEVELLKVEFLAQNRSLGMTNRQVHTLGKRVKEE
jgi:hypothetical protein